MNAKSPLELLDKVETFAFKPHDNDYIYLTHRQNPFMKDYKYKTVDLDQIAKDNDLDNDYSMAERRADYWGDDINKYEMSYDDLVKSYRDNPIRVDLYNGKYRILDGHHRIKALRNMGYNKAPIYLKETQ